MLLAVDVIFLLNYKVLPDENIIVFNNSGKNYLLNEKEKNIVGGESFYTTVKNIDKGSYLVDISGQNVDECTCIMSYKKKKHYIGYNVEKRQKDKIALYINLNQDIKNFEIEIHNTSNENVTIEDINLLPYKGTNYNEERTNKHFNLINPVKAIQNNLESNHTYDGLIEYFKQRFKKTSKFDKAEHSKKVKNLYLKEIEIDKKRLG